MTTRHVAVPEPDTARHLDIDTLCGGLDGLPSRPTDEGSVAYLVGRRIEGDRALHDEAVLSIEHGMAEDRWRKRDKGLDDQLTVMDVSVARLIANGQPLEMFGDNLYVDLDLSTANLPVGSVLQMGSVELEVTPEPHDGCAKFMMRFGKDALRLVAHKTWRHNNYRGIYVKVLKSGIVATGDRVRVLCRPAASSR